MLPVGCGAVARLQRLREQRCSLSSSLLQQRPVFHLTLSSWSMSCAPELCGHLPKPEPSVRACLFSQPHWELPPQPWALGSVSYFICTVGQLPPSPCCLIGGWLGSAPLSSFRRLSGRHWGFHQLLSPSNREDGARVGTQSLPVCSRGTSGDHGTGQLAVWARERAQSSRSTAAVLMSSVYSPQGSDSC